MPDGPPEEIPVDPDLLVLDEDEVRALIGEEHEPEPVESYVPPYVPDPPPEIPAADSGQRP